VIVAVHSKITPVVFLGVENVLDFTKDSYEQLANAKQVCP
jgi:hypothetical protein